MPPTLTVETETWPLAGTFRISRDARTVADVLVATIRDGDLVGRGECVPYRRYGETVKGVRGDIEGHADAIAEGLDRDGLRNAMKPGAARNAIDCALWDLEAKRQSLAANGPGSVRAWNVAGLPPVHPVRTVYTISLDAPDAMRTATEIAVGEGRSLLKVKLGGQDGADDARIKAVRAAAPDASLIVDANEGWRAGELVTYLAAAREAGVEMVEQPLPAGEDEALDDARTAGWLGEGEGAILLGADESVHTRKELKALRGRYDIVNIKLDKAGGLTEALATASTARTLGFEIMVGCMMGTSLAMAPALLVAQRARFVDLDGPLWMKRDRKNGLKFDGQTVHPPDVECWG